MVNSMLLNMLKAYNNKLTDSDYIAQRNALLEEIKKENMRRGLK